MDLLITSMAALMAGFVDAIIGGGGLIMTPALLAIFPHAPVATLLGTNKGVGVWGTAFATLQFHRKVRIAWRIMLPAALASFASAFAGAWLVTLVSADFLRKLLPFILIAVLAYTLARKDMGKNHSPRFQGRAALFMACAIGAALGFYDGFFGPGTGSFLVFAMVRLLGYDFLNASASAKLLNTASNASALVLFAAKGHVWWHMAMVLALANIVGSLLGTRMALKHGSGFVRIMFVAVVSALILKTVYDAFMH